MSKNKLMFCLSTLFTGKNAFKNKRFVFFIYIINKNPLKTIKNIEIAERKVNLCVLIIANR
jgi:hypothetical protein